MTSSTTQDDIAAGRSTLLPTLTSLRFLVAAVIFLFHGTNYVLFSSAGVGEGYLGVVTMGGWAGMTFFFLLSGFVLTWVSGPGYRVSSFWRRRLTRVFPNHLVMLAVTALITVLVLDQAVDGGIALIHATLLQAWFPQLDVRIALNSVSWSLSAELLFYLCFPVLLGLVRRIPANRLWAATTGVLAIIAIAVPLLVNRLPHDEIMPFLEMSQEQFWVLFHFPPVRMLEFVTGMLIARIVLTGRRVPVSFGGAAAVVVTAYALGPLFPPTFRMVGVMVAPLALLIAAAATHDLRRQRTSLLASRPMVRLGDLSYAFYLVHLQVLVVGGLLLGTDEPVSTPYGIAVLVLLFAVAVGVSWLLNTLVEQPMMRRFGGRSRIRTAAAAPAGSAPAAGRAPAKAGADAG